MTARPSRRRVDSNNVKSRIAIVSPNLAVLFRARKRQNRPLKPYRVTEYANAMARGEWQLNGHAIVFDKEGYLIDGQHRLEACIESGEPFETVIVEGVPDDVFFTIDQGANRTLGDHLTVEGFDLGRRQSRLVTACSMVLSYRTGQFAQKTDPKKLVALAKAEPNIVNWVEDAYRVSFPRAVRNMSAYMAATMHIASTHLPEKARLFMERVGTGENIVGGTAEFTLRNRILRDVPKGNKTKQERLYIVVAAWNAFAHNRPFSKYSWTPDFPRIVGEDSDV